MRFLVANEQLAKAGKPRVRYFDDPAARALALGALRTFLTARPNMWRVVSIDHVLACHRANEASVGAQVLAGVRYNRWPHGDDGIEGGHELGDVIAIGRMLRDLAFDGHGVRGVVALQSSTQLG